mgnify:CR=1 FL=1
MARVAYLAPEIPALSATFVYEELLALEKTGIDVVPVSVRRPSQIANVDSSLVDRVKVLYPLGISNSGQNDLKLAAISFRGVAKAFSWLLRDMLSCWRRPVAAAKLGYQFLAAMKLASVLREQRCCHLHVHFAHVPAQIAAYASALSGVPFTITAHANDIFERGMLLKQKANRASRFLTISQFNLAYLEKIGLPREKLAVVRCGVSFAAENAQQVRQPVGGVHIGSLGRLVEKKGMAILIKAVARLREDGLDVQLSIAGDGPLESELKALALRSNVHDAVKFLGAVSHSDVQSWLQSLDIFALACVKDSAGDMDGIPVAIMEAMSQQIPCVSTRLSGIPELVIDGETGLLALFLWVKPTTGQIIYGKIFKPQR